MKSDDFPSNCPNENGQPFREGGTENYPFWANDDADASDWQVLLFCKEGGFAKWEGGG